MKNTKVQMTNECQSPLVRAEPAVAWNVKILNSLGKVFGVELLGVILFLILFPTCCWGGLPPVVAEIGKTQITEEAINYLIKVESAYGNETITEATALILLINDTLEQEVGRLNGVLVTSEEIKSMSEHVDKNTKAPQILAAVKSAFGQDTDSYGRLYLSPKIINGKLHSWFNRNTEIHKGQREQIEKAYSLVATGTSFEKAAEELELNYSVNDYGGEAIDNTMPTALKPYFPEHKTKFGNDPFIKILKSLSPDEIFKNIVEDDRTYKVIRLLEKVENKYKFESITVNKQSFDEWFRKQAGKIKIEIKNPAMAKAIRDNYPNLWWRKSFQVLP